MAEAIGTGRGLFTRYGLRAIVLIALLLLTSIATAVGLTDLIQASEADGVRLIEYIVVGALATGAILTMWLALEFTIELHRWWQRLASFTVYLILVLWSIGFGFGFYWKHIASVVVARDQVETMTKDVGKLADQADKALRTVRNTVANVAIKSRNAQIKERQGNSCTNVSSGFGEGGLSQARNQIATDVEGASAGIQIWINGRTSAPALEPLPQPDGVGNSTASDAAAAALGNSSVPAAQATPTVRPTQSPAAQPVAQGDDLAGEIEALKRESEAVSKTYGQGAKDPAEMRDRVLALSRHAQDIVSRINDIVGHKAVHIDRLKSIQQSVRDGVTVGGKTCKDEALAKDLEAAIYALDHMKALPEDKAVLDPQLGARATQYAFFRLWNNVFPFLSEKNPDGTNKSEPLGSQDIIALVAAIVVDIGILFLTVFGRTGGDTGAITGLVTRPLPPRMLRRRLFALVNSSDNGLRELFDRSLAQEEDDFYLVSSEQLPAFHGAIRNLQIMLLAARLGIPVAMRQSLWARLRKKPHALLERMQRVLASAAALPDSGATTVDPDAFEADQMTVLRLTPQLTFALQRLLAQRGGDDGSPDGGASPNPADDPRAPGDAGRG
ncbi:MAG: hypothetical protein V4574_08510 [Pseudomonadota bacterium]